MKAIPAIITIISFFCVLLTAKEVCPSQQETNKTVLFQTHLSDCNDGSAESCYKAAKIHSENAYREPGYDDKRAAAKIAELYKRSCELGFAKGCTAYAMSYAADPHPDPDKSMSYYFQKGCEGGDEQACTMLHMMVNIKK